MFKVGDKVRNKVSGAVGVVLVVLPDWVVVQYKPGSAPYNIQPRCLEVVS